MFALLFSCNLTRDRSQLPVHNDTVPLAAATKVSGLRAVFGDHYPDPVRVVSVGPTVADLLSSPQDALWKDFSVEFCGGTHIDNTGEAVAFAITGESLPPLLLSYWNYGDGCCCVDVAAEESGVAKGIRRVVGVTGRDALSAAENSRQFEARVDQLTATLTAGADLVNIGSSASDIV